MKKKYNARRCIDRALIDNADEKEKEKKKVLKLQEGPLDGGLEREIERPRRCHLPRALVSR